MWASRFIRALTQAPPVNYVLSTRLNITFHSISITKAINLLGRPLNAYSCTQQHSPLDRFEPTDTHTQKERDRKSTNQSTKYRQRQLFLCRLGLCAKNYVAPGWVYIVYIVFPFNFPFSHVQKALLWRIMLIKSSASQQQCTQQLAQNADNKRQVFRIPPFFLILVSKG